MFKELIVNNFMGSGSQCYDVMYTVTRAFQVKKMVEIGTFLGISTMFFCQAILDNKAIPEIHTLDKWGQFGQDYQHVKVRTIENFNKLGFLKYITMYDGDSQTALLPIFEKIGNVDLCFIDGDHTYEGVINDFNICKQFTNIMLLHDTLDGGVKYLRDIREMGWNVVTFPTRYVESDSHLIGISLVLKNND
ncbi:MAG: class I SAM-dependent methyltransferase [Patescibacteria group bacterium]|jgi:hypothetical protein